MVLPCWRSRAEMSGMSNERRIEGIYILWCSNGEKETVKEKVFCKHKDTNRQLREVIRW